MTSTKADPLLAWTAAKAAEKAAYGAYFNAKAGLAWGRVLEARRAELEAAKRERDRAYDAYIESVYGPE